MLRNFGVLGWGEHLVALAEGELLVAHGVMGLDDDELGEVERIRAAIDRRAQEELGSGIGSQALAAADGLARLLALRSRGVKVSTLNEKERRLAVRLQSRESADRAWRQSDLGLRARRLDLGESVSIAIAVARDLPFACDDSDGQRAYRALAAGEPFQTLDLVKLAAERSLLSRHDAYMGYTELVESDLHRFGGSSWV